MRRILMKEYNTLDDFELKEKTALLRVDFNLPLDKKTLTILDTTRIKLALPTIQELHENRAKTVILAHQGRQGSWDFINMKSHAHALEQLLKIPVTFINDIYGKTAQEAIKSMHPGEIIFLDNVRKFDGETEKKNPEEHAQSELVQNLYPLADFYINDAFAAAHRKQCSLVGFTAVLPSCAGRLLEKELTTLEKVIKNPDKPAIFLFGGAKYSDIIITIDRILSNKLADTILLTGLPANAFLKSQGYNLGDTNEQTLLTEGSEEQFKEIKKLYQKYKNKIYLPADFAIEKENSRIEISLQELPTEFPLYDIGYITINKYKDILKTAKTVFLSGPCGVFENPHFRQGTTEIFSYIAKLDVTTIVGGGHTVAAIEKLGLRDTIGHISTGGGSLEKFMMGEKLPVIEALKKAYKKTVKCS
jgi:phosphoglycerate kinase